VRGRQPTARANSFGAAGAVEAVLTVHALHDGVVRHNLNLKALAPEIDLDVVADSPPRRRLPLPRHQLLRARQE